MDVFVIISQALLYLSFSVLAGSFILLLVPKQFRPDLKISKRLLLISGMALPVFAFIPILDIALFMAPRLGLFESLKLVLTTYSAGTSWNFTLLGSIILVLLIAIAKPAEKGRFAFLGIVLTLGLMLTITWSSHAGSMDPILGIISDFIHLAAVSIWVGILLIIGWCALNRENWLPFLSWFSVVAISCLVATALSGVLLMDVLVDDYNDAWMVSYGQGLLIKHLFLLPVIFYALVNGMIVKFKMTKDPTFNPIPWIRVEGFLLFIIFVVTAFFTQQSPAHGPYLTSDAVSPLFRLFHGDTIDASSTIGFVVNGNTVSFFFLALLFIGLMLLSFFKKVSIGVSFLFSCFFVISVYLMIMMTVVVR